MNGIFSPFRLGPVSLRNRVVKTATFEGMTKDGVPTDALVAFHRALAAGKVALTTVAYGAVSPEARTFDTQMWLSPEAMPGLRKLTDAVHAEGGAASIQLTHCGGFSKSAAARAQGGPLAPSFGVNRLGVAHGIPFTRAMGPDDLRKVVDDFGRERISPEQLLNRFITPMEHNIDYFTLRTGQKIVMPLRHVLIIATNLSPDSVTDPAFLRRMGYRLYLGPPSVEMYTKIFQEYAARNNAKFYPEVLEKLLERYKEQNRELRACEPRDLIERSKDICEFHGRPLELSQKVMDLAWTGYFGEPPRKQA